MTLVTDVLLYIYIIYKIANFDILPSKLHLQSKDTDAKKCNACIQLHHIWTASLCSSRLDILCETHFSPYPYFFIASTVL